MGRFKKRNQQRIPVFDRKMRKFKAIFGNPPFSYRKKEKGAATLLWQHFSKSSLEVADEVYYITPYLWNGNVRKFLLYADEKIKSVDFNISEHFDIFESICYWQGSKINRDFKVEITAKNQCYIISKLSDIKYIPYNMHDTLSIHQKAWAKNPIGIQRCDFLDSHDNLAILKKEQDDEYKYPVIGTNIKKPYYTNKGGIERFGIDLYQTPKVIISNVSGEILFDRVGEYATTHSPKFLTDTLPNLEIRYKQLHSSFAKFWFATSRQSKGNKPDILLYMPAMSLFPDIPLHITEDQDIYEWLGLTDNEIEVVKRLTSE